MPNKTQHGNARGKLQAPVALQLVQQPNANAVVLPLDGRHFRSESVLQNLVLVGEHLHRRLVGQEIFEVVEDENANALFRIAHTLQTRLQALDDGGESMLLDEVEQPLFRLEVVIKPGQRHAAGAREIAHRSAFVSLFAENFGGVGQDFGKAPVVAGSRNGRAALPA